MPPKADINTLLAKRDIAVKSLYVLFEEFHVVYCIEAELETLEKVYKKIDAKFTTAKKQLEVISYKIIDNGISEDETVAKVHEKVGIEVKEIYLKCTASFATYGHGKRQKAAKIVSRRNAIVRGIPRAHYKEMPLKRHRVPGNGKDHAKRKKST